MTTVYTVSSENFYEVNGHVYRESFEDDWWNEPEPCDCGCGGSVRLCVNCGSDDRDGIRCLLEDSPYSVRVVERT